MTTPPSGFDELQRLAGEAGRLARMFSVEPDESRTFEGHDESELVHAEVDAEGRVTDVRLDRDWDRTLDPRRLGAAVVEAVNAATITRVSSWADRVADAQDAAAEGEPPAAPRPAPQPITINPSGKVVEDLLYLLHRVGQETKPPERPARRRARDDDYDDYEDEAPVAPTRLTRGKSEGGHVVVGLDGKQVAEVQVETDSMWIGTANHLEVASELRSAFAAAYEKAAEQETTRGKDSAVAELRALTANPQEFVNKLFGLDR